MAFSFHQCRRIRNFAASVLFGSILLGMLGCGAGGGSANVVSGTVKFNGNPFPGTIMFASQSDSKNVSSAIIEENGSYRMANPPLGMVDVAFQPRTQSSDPKAPPPPKIPDKYQQGTTSGQSFEVKKGNQTKNFDLAP